MSTKTNLLGQKFGKWTVIAEAPSLKTSYKALAIWTCQCECGVIKNVRADDLRNGRSTQCISCARSKHKGKERINYQQEVIKSKNNNNSSLPRTNIIDETNNQYQFFKVIEYAGSNNRGAAQWRCLCHCGKEFIALGTAIRNQHIISCGCINRSKGELKIEQILSKNNIPFKSEYSFSDLKDKNLLRFDFAIFDSKNNLIKLIEFQGEQHYEQNNFFTTNPKEHDELKRNYCKQNNIKLLEIPYWDYYKIDLNYLLNN